MKASSDQKSQWRPWHVVVLGLVLLFGLSIAFTFEGDDAAVETEAAPSTTEGPTTAPAPTQPARPTTTTSTTTAPTTTAAPRRATIPGLDAFDVTLSMEKIGFDCDNGDFGREYRTFSCDRDVDNVSVFTDDSRHPYQVEANALGSDARELLMYVASVPYTGAQQREAQSWVNDNFDRVRQGSTIEANFGGVPYTLYGNPSGGAYVLEIGRLSE